MAYLILEGGGPPLADSGGYFDFDPQNSNDVAEVKNMLAAHRNGIVGLRKPVSLLCGWGGEDSNLKTVLYSLLHRLFRGKSETPATRRPTRTIPAISHRIRNRRRTGRSTSDFSVV